MATGKMVEGLMTRMTYREWIQQAGTKPIVWPERKPNIYIRVRCIPAVYAQHTARIADGEPLADISINTSVLSFPAPLQPNGYPTVECREWLTQAVAETVHRDGHKRCIIWPDMSATTFDDDGQPHLTQPSADQEPPHG